LAAFASTLGKIGLGGVVLNAIGSFLGQGPADIAQQIVDVNEKLNKVDKWAEINESWSNTVVPLMKTFISLGSEQGFGDFLAGKFGAGPVSIAEQIKDVNEKLKDIDFKTGIPANYVENLSGNIKAYVDLISYLKEKGYGDNIDIGSIFGISSGIARLADDYSRLAKGVKNLGNALSSIDMEKLNALNMMSGSIVLMSLMDSEQFEKMMDALEEKAGIFVSTINMLQGEAEKSGAANMNVPSGSKGNPNSEVVSVLNQIRDNTAGLSSLASLPGAINNLKTSLTSLIQELKDEAKHRKMGK
jgi:hypothetical protein